MLYVLTSDLNGVELQCVVNASSEKEAISSAARASEKCFEDNRFHLSNTGKHAIEKWSNKDKLEQSGYCSGTARVLLCNGQAVPFSYCNDKGIKSVFNKANQQYKQIKVLFITKQSSKPLKVKRSSVGRAKAVLNDKEAANDELNKFKEKYKVKSQAISQVGQQNPDAAAYIREIPTMFSMIQDYVKGNYREIPLKSIIGITAAVIYFVSPIDFIPDFIPVFGQLDDIGVLLKAMKCVYSDVLKYKEWKNGTRNKVAS